MRTPPETSPSTRNSRWELRDVTTAGNFGKSDIVVSGGGQLLAPDSAANLRLGAASTGSGTLTVGDAVGGPELFDSQASVFVGGTETAAGGSGQLSVLATGSAHVDGQIKVWGAGRLEALGGDIQAQQLVVTSGGRLSIDDGGSVEAMTVQLESGANLSGFDDGQLIVRGPGGASFSPPSSSFGFGSDSGLPTIHLDNATSFVENWTIANFPGAAAKTIVSGQQGRLDASGDLLVTGPNTNNNGTLEILAGGLAQAGNDIKIGFASSSVGHVVVDGSSGGRRSLLRNTAQGADGEIIVGSNGRGTLDVLDGALVQSLNNISIAAFSSAEGTVNITGSATGGTSLVSASNQLFVGGFATTENSGGTGSLNINDRGQVIAGQRMKVYADGSVTLTPGALLETPLLDTGGTIENDGVINIGGSTLPTADGDLVVSSTGGLFMFGGRVRTRNVTFEAGASFDLFAGTLEVDGGQMQLNQASVAYGSPAGFPITTFELAGGATSSVASSWRMGDDPLTFGRAVVRGAGSRLENTNVDGAADLIAGLSGSGILEVLDGGAVDFNDDVIAAQNPGSTGTIFVRGVAGTDRATVRAVGGTNSDIVVGWEGFGGMDVVDGALVEAADDLYVGLVAGADGVVTVSGSQNGFDATINVGDELAIGATFTGGAVVNKGTGLVVIAAGGQVQVADTTYVGPDDTLVLSGGSLHTGALNIESDLSRLAWDAGELALTASGLLVDTGGALDREITLDDDMVLSVHGSRFVGSNGVVLLEGGQFVGNDELIIEDAGFLGGHGTVATPVFMENSGRVFPAGTLLVEGIYIQESIGELGVAIGPNTGETDLLAVTQTADLDGLLEISSGSLLDPDVRGNAEQYVLLTAGTLAGSFDTVIYDVTDLTALADVQTDGSFSAYVGQSAFGDDGLFRALNYTDGEVTFTNYLAIPGDANGDQVVDGQDFVIWKDHRFTSGTNWTNGDFNGDGVTDGRDLLIWNQHKFQSASVVQRVPEPSSFGAGLVGLLIALCRSRRQRTTYSAPRRWSWTIPRGGLPGHPELL